MKNGRQPKNTSFCNYNQDMVTIGLKLQEDSMEGNYPFSKILKHSQKSILLHPEKRNKKD